MTRYLQEEVHTSTSTGEMHQVKNVTNRATSYNNTPKYNILHPNLVDDYILVW